MKLRKYANDPNIRSMMGAATGVRFTGVIVDKLEDGKTVVMQVEMPDNEGYVRSQVKMIRPRFEKVSLFDTITGVGDLTRGYKKDKLVMSFVPSVFVIRNKNGRQVV